MNISEMKESKYLKKEDVIPDALVTIDGLHQENMAQEGQPEDMKYTLKLREFPKPMVLNWTNIQLCALATGTEETTEWPGKQIVLYNDPSVSFGGQLTGGIRIRAANQAQPQAPQFDEANPPPIAGVNV